MNNINNRSMLASLRSLMPSRALDYAGARTIAEAQANRLVEASGFDLPPFSLTALGELPRIDVRVAPSLPTSGMSAWSRGKWQIRINGAEAPVRQRFTLAHEFKHVLDAPFEDVIYRDLKTGDEREAAIEAICDYFAACLLMPKKWVKRYFGQGMQDPVTLAWRFDVSPQAMSYRLSQLGLVDAAQRCRGVSLVRQDRRPKRTYFRVSSLEPTTRLVAV